MNFFRVVRNYLFYCGIDKEDYYAVRKATHVSNFKTWRILNCLMTAAFALLFIDTFLSNALAENRWYYLAFLLYSALTTLAFFFIKKESYLAQLWIYVSISALLFFGCLISANHPEIPANTFIVMLLITPLFIIDKAIFTGIELAAASALFTVWTYYAKPHDIWELDYINVIIFGVLGFVIHIISNSVRIREFVLARKLKIQKDIDDLTDLKNKGALTRAIDKVLANPEKEKGIFCILDIDHFKMINDTYGHTVGDSVIHQLGVYLGSYFTGGEIVGRFGGDEFIFFIEGADDRETAKRIADEILAGVPEHIVLPDETKKVNASIGIALYHGVEQNYSEIFNKADAALYEVKSDRTKRYQINA